MNILDFFRQPEKKMRFRYEGGISYHDILYLIHKKRGRIMRRRGDPSKPLEKLYKSWENRNRNQTKEFLDRLNAYPDIPMLSPGSPIKLTEFVIHTLEHLMLFYLFYLTVACAAGKYDLYPWNFPMNEYDDVDDYWDADVVSENKRDFLYESIVLLYLGVFICGIISCYCLHYYSMRPDWNSLRAVTWTAYDLSFIKKSPFGYEYKRPIVGKVSPRLETFYKVWFPYYYGNTYSDHCFGSTYYGFLIKRRYIPGFKRSYYWKRRINLHMKIIISDIKALRRRRGYHKQLRYQRKVILQRLMRRMDVCQNIRDWFASEFPNMYVHSTDKEYRKRNGYVKRQRTLRFRRWRKKRRMF